MKPHFTIIEAPSSHKLPQKAYLSIPREDVDGASFAHDVNDLRVGGGVGDELVVDVVHRYQVHLQAVAAPDTVRYTVTRYLLFSR